MRILRSKKRWAASTVGVAVIGVFATVALGNGPNSGFVGQTPLVTAKLDNSVQMNSDRVKFQTKDPTYVRVQEFNIASGGLSGWHHHPGIVIAAVQSGAVTFTNSDCSSETYGYDTQDPPHVLPAGSVFTEGNDDPGQASSVSGALLYATFVAPHAVPPVFRIVVAAQTC